MALVTAFTAGTLWGGGSGLNVIVVVNQNSTNSVQLGSDYCQLRGVPPQNVLRLTGWTGGSISWSRSDFETYLRNPLLAMLTSRGLTNQAEYVLLSMDIPFTVSDSGTANSSTSTLFYGFKADAPPPLACLPASCSLPDSSSNSYAFCELPFREAPPNTSTTNSFLTMMLTDNTLAQAELVLLRGVASDHTSPTQAVYLNRTSDTARSVRYVEFDNAILATRVRGDNSLVWTNTDSTAFTNLLGLMTGWAVLTLPTNTFVPGAMGDSLTSWAGLIFGDSGGQTTLLAFLNAGAAGSYGTVTEPCNYTQKFPDALNYFYQNRGFCLAESYYQSIQNPYQGLLVGEPLAAPFAHPGSADWSSLTHPTVLSGQAPLNLTFSAASTNLPLAKVDLFLDGTYVQTVTNLLPSASNILSATLNNFTVTYTVPTNATVASVASGLAAALNAQTNSTRVLARAVGDRLELQSLQVTVPGTNVTLKASTAAGATPRLTTLTTPARPAFMDSAATGYFSVLASNTPVVGDWLRLDFTKTNGMPVTVSTTNTTPNTTIAVLLQTLFNLVNATTDLQSADGVLAADYADDTYCGIVAAQMTLYARSPGWPASEIKVAFSASTNLLTLPPGTSRLQDNLNDLRPRNHLYVSSGAATLPINFVLDTTRISDGYHQLTAVATEGTSVRTQTRVSRTVRIQNTTLTSTFTPMLSGTNATLDVPLRITVKPNAAHIDRIELFSTGGLIDVVSNQLSAVFTVPSASLGLGLHPFYALVTDSIGERYQTQTAWIRLVPAFQLSISGTPLQLSWSATPGLRYDVLATTNLSRAFQVTASLVATNTTVQWRIPTSSAATSFYRVGLSQ
ncbi:MAG: TIGR03790 family protein [Verrucomicrobia bacterium]|nr:TIGR03790 family protein [Verrucomicrobiota bacterium]